MLFLHGLFLLGQCVQQSFELIRDFDLLVITGNLLPRHTA